VKKIAVIVAGGSGSRMKSETPKQFIQLRDFPLLYFSILPFHKHPDNVDLFVVLPLHQIDNWKNLCSIYSIDIPHQIVEGGPTRFHSVKSGLKACSGSDPNSVVAIHDGVRPFVSQTVISEGYTVAGMKGSAIPVVPVRESLRQVSGSFSSPVPREKYCLVQTPQFFQLGFISDSYLIQYSETFTDDAGVFESSGRQVTLIEGNKENIKITDPQDMHIAQKLVEIFY
jgi:2-C-methyl-D-erythritol 4-phosphate cytidylyltransferase